MTDMHRMVKKKMAQNEEVTGTIQNFFMRLASALSLPTGQNRR
jgi:hypothetical protein